MQKKVYLALVCCMAALLALCALFNKSLQPASASTPSLELFVPNPVYAHHNPFQVYVRAVNPGSLSAFEFTLQLDQTLATVSAVQPMLLLGVSDQCIPASLTCAVALGPKEKTDGAHLAIYTFGVANPVTSDGLIAIITLQPKGKDGRVTLHITNPLITNAAGQAVIPLTADAVFDLAEKIPTFLPMVRKTLP
jgi:hypothetical protein